MQIQFWVIGKTSDAWLEEGIQIYLKRIERYLPFTMEIIHLRKKHKEKERLKIQEAESILKKLDKSDHLILLDDKGKSFSSEEFANYLQSKLHLSSNRLVFLVGGAYGFDQSVYARANGKLSLSKMTFSHQMVRVFFLEQVYRALTILNNEPYHH